MADRRRIGGTRRRPVLATADPWDGVAYGSYVEAGRIVTFRMDEYKRGYCEPVMADFDRSPARVREAGRRGEETEVPAMTGRR